MHGTTRAPMAEAILKDIISKEKKKNVYEIMSRGIIVHFEEPMNQKAEAVLAGNKIAIEGYISKLFIPEEINDKTIVFTFEEKLKQIILEKYDILNEENTFVLSYYVGEELETFDPYGEPIVTYGLCYEALKETITKLIKKLGE